MLMFSLPFFPFILSLLTLVSLAYRSPSPTPSLPTLPRVYPTPSEEPSQKFLVECYCFIKQTQNNPQTNPIYQSKLPTQFGYEFRAFGYAKKTANGLNIRLDNQKILLSIKGRHQSQKDYDYLYQELVLIPQKSRNPVVIEKETPVSEPCHEQNCSTSTQTKTKTFLYSPQNFSDPLTLIYDQQQGLIFLEHRLKNGITLKGKGGCIFVPLPSTDKNPNHQ